MLSNVDVLKELNENVFIYPLKLANIRGSSINLRASKNAWSLGSGNSIVENGKIKIPAHDTALIMTEVVIHVTSKLGGLYHSKVTLVSNGMGHVGTTLDPEWYGKSLIAIHNLSKSDYIIDVGETFVSLTLYYLNSEEKECPPNNFTGRCDVLDKLHIAYDTHEIGVDAVNQNDLDEFKKKCREEQKALIAKKLKPYNPPWYKTRKFRLILPIVLIIMAIVLSLICINGNNRDIVKDYALPIASVVLAVLFGELLRVKDD